MFLEPDGGASAVFILVWPALCGLLALLVLGLIASRFVAARLRPAAVVHGEFSAAGGAKDGTARPQILRRGGEQLNVWPQHWGITLEQCKRFLAECRAQPGWSARNNMYTVVEDYIKPRTEGTGLGLALLTNREEPLEVNVMISHAWNENAEDFFGALERTVAPTDVLFICALSLYQCPDGCGPSIPEQLGASAAESPFHRVLQHIRARGLGDGALWRWGEQLRGIAPLCMLLALTLLLGPVMTIACVPTAADGWRVVCFSGQSPEEPSSRFRGRGFTGEWELTTEGERIEAATGDTLSYEVLSTVAALSCASCAVVVACSLRCARAYRGRMVVVPNRECDIYTRLWCVYEIFVARTFAVPVVLAHSMAHAGAGSCRKAVCGNEEDMQRIRGEIECYGTSMCGKAEEGYSLVDLAIRRMKRSMRFALLVPSVLQFWPVMLVQVSLVRLCVDAPIEYGVYWAMLAIVCFILAVSLVLYTMYRLSKLREGRLRRADMYKASLIFCLVGAGQSAFLIVVANSVIDTAADPAGHFVLPLLMFGTTLLDSGVSMCGLALAHRLCFQQSVRVHWLCSVTAHIAWCGQLAALGIAALGTMQGGHAITTGFYLMLGFSLLGFGAAFCSTARVWDVRIRRPVIERAPLEDHAK